MCRPGGEYAEYEGLLFDCQQKMGGAEHVGKDTCPQHSKNWLNLEKDAPKPVKANYVPRLT